MKYYNFVEKKLFNKALSNISATNVNKKIIVLISIIILAVVIFSGYNILLGLNSSNDKIIIEEKKVEILNISVSTQWSTGCKCDDTYQEHIKPGFYHTVDIGSGAYYKIKGEITNNIEEKIDKITINAKFYDKNGTELFDAIQLNSSVIIYNLTKGEFKKFSLNLRPEQYYYLHKDENLIEVYNKFYSVETYELDIFYR